MRTTNKTLDSSEQYQAIQCLWLQVTPTVIFYLNIATLFREHMQENCMFSLTGKEVLTEFTYKPANVGHYIQKIILRI